MSDANPPRAQHKQPRAKSTEKKETPMVMVEDLVGANADTMEAFVHAGEAVFQSMGSFSEEVMTFSEKRMKAAADTAQSFVKCSTFAEAMEIQSDYARSATRDYLDEAVKLMRLSTQVARDGMTPFARQAGQSLTALKD